MIGAERTDTEAASPRRALLKHGLRLAVTMICVRPWQALAAMGGKRKLNRTVWAWGTNSSGELGLGDTVNRSSPVQVGSMTNWVQVVSTWGSSIALHSDGTLWTWGLNSFGELGVGDTVNRSSPVQVGSMTNWTQVDGAKHILALRGDGTLWAWGNNPYGELGQGDIVSRSSPVQVGGLTSWTQVAVGADSIALALRSDGTIWSWGYNGFGDLGQADTVSRSSPVQIGSLTNWAYVACGFDSMYAIRSDGTLWSWGYNAHGQLGLGDTVNRSSPVQVGSLSEWTQVKAGGGDSVLALRADGTLWSWGFNPSGSLGLGDAVDRSSPVQVGSLTNWLQVIAGGATSFGIRSDGTLWAWGDNSYGELGLGDTVSRSSPVQVGSLTGWTAVASGKSYSATLALR